MSRAKPKLVDFPGPMDRGGRRNVAMLARHTKNDKVDNVLCIYETTDGELRWFRNNLSIPQAALRILQVQDILLKESRE